MKAHPVIEKEVLMIGKQIEESKFEIAKSVLSDEFEYDKALKLSEEIVQLCADAILIGKNDAEDRITKWARETGEYAVNYGSELDVLLKNTSQFRQAIWNVIEEASMENNYSIKTVFEVSRIIDPLIDQAVYAFSTAYVASYRSSLSHAQEVFLELSVPVVPILEGVAVLPIVGDIDTHRASLLMETALRESTQKSLTHMFIDLSGVTIVDTMVANNIFSIIYSLQLLGVKGILSGIRPEVAQTMIHLGIDFSSIQTHSTLKQALAKHILN
ncbi:STAS domain-containing protein [Bacillus sp. NTK071]|uniref:STAS domain-containing protein n=1 Tax=Bacillus sp. NTK071 TaxID=2802175 RepID=UPI002570D472|nr:STAS domain-containing protein [Bacillus sp. NTK071]